MQCPRCNGSGDCAECGGTGSVECPTCNGKGVRSTSRGVEYDCKACTGTGRMPCSTACSSCDGSGEITEKLQKETREKYRPKFTDYSPSALVTGPIIALNIGVFLLVRAKPELLNWIGLSTTSLDSGHYWSLITPSFIHLAPWHLLLNLVFLWTYGQVVEGLLGKRRFVLLYLLTALGANAVSWFGNIQVDGNYYAGIGASGPLYGLIGALLAIHLRWSLVPAGEIRRLVTWAGGFIVLGFAFSNGILGWVDNWGHLGGAVAGFITMYLMPRPQGR